MPSDELLSREEWPARASVPLGHLPRQRFETPCPSSRVVIAATLARHRWL